MWRQNWAEKKDISTFHTVTLSTWVRPASLLLQLNLWCISECGYIIPNKPVIYLKLNCFLFHFLFLLFFYFYYLKKINFNIFWSYSFPAQVPPDLLLFLTHLILSSSLKSNQNPNTTTKFPKPRKENTISSKNENRKKN